MCGNGIRCVAKYVYDYGLTDKTSISVETLGGIKYLDLTIKDGKVALVKVDMGKPELKPERIPIVSDEERVVNEPIIVGGMEYRMTGVSMGNPHVVVYVKDLEGVKIEHVGPKFENHEEVPKKSQYGVCQGSGPQDRRDARVGERLRRDSGLWNRRLRSGGSQHIKRDDGRPGYRETAGR